MPAGGSGAWARALAYIRDVLRIAALASAGVTWLGCAARTDDVFPGVLRPCREQEPVQSYLVPAAQQCWYTAPNGRWRTLNHELHYDVLVVESEATSLADAEEVTRRFVGVHSVSKDSTAFSEITVYVQEETAPPTSTVRRVSWSRASGAYEVVEFEGSLQRR